MPGVLRWGWILLVGSAGLIPALVERFLADGNGLFTAAAWLAVALGIVVAILGAALPNVFLHVLAACTVAGGVFGVAAVLLDAPGPDDAGALWSSVGDSLLAVVFAFVLGLFAGAAAAWTRRRPRRAAHGSE